MHNQTAQSQSIFKPTDYAMQD